MNHCAVRHCPEPPCTLMAYVDGKPPPWYFCRQHFWKGVHTLLNRDAHAVVVGYRKGSEHWSDGTPFVER